MRFMAIVKATKESEAGILPSEKQLAEMGAFNEELVTAGILRAAEGLQASKKGARITFVDGKPVVTDGPFAETKELVAGFTIVEVKSKEEAIKLFSRFPFHGAELEIRQVFEAEDFGSDFTPELREQEERHRRELSAN